MTEIITFNGAPIIAYAPELDREIRKKVSTGEISGVSIDFNRGAKTLFRIGELSFLEDLKTLVIQGKKHPQIGEEELRRCKSLVTLSLDEAPKQLDIRLIPTLRWLALDWRPGAILGADSSKLRSFHVWGLSCDKSDNTWPAFDYLEDLQLVRCKLTNLSGINIYKKLNAFAIHYARNLVSLDGLENSTITKFEATNCPNIRSYETLKSCSYIEELKIHRCGPISNLHFVNHLRKLRTFRFMNTDVLDGDLSPLLDIEDVMFTEKRHFSHRTSHFRQIDTGFD